MDELNPEPTSQPAPYPAPHLVPVPTPSRAVPWDDIRNLYVKGVVVGPDLPDRTEVLQELGEGDTLEKARRRADGGKVTRVGVNRVVFPNVRAVANYFRAPERLVETRARDEDWLGLQRIYRAQLHQRQGQLRSQRRLLDVEHIDRRAFAVARVGLKMVFDRLEMMSQTVEVMDGEVSAVADYRELESLAKSASVWHALGRRSLGFPVDKVGVGWSGDSGEVAGFGSMPLETGGSGSEDELVAMTDERPSVAAELGKDDAERLHGFLQVLGRAQQASRSEADADAETA